MVQKIEVLLVDDVDGGRADETVTFSLDGVHYEIDLSGKNAEELRGAIGEWVSYARRVGGRGKVKSAAKAKVDLADVRAWARDNGFQVSDRGRVSGEVMAAYEAQR